MEIIEIIIILLIYEAIGYIVRHVYNKIYHPTPKQIYSTYVSELSEEYKQKHDGRLFNEHLIYVGDSKEEAENAGRDYEFPKSSEFYNHFDVMTRENGEVVFSRIVLEKKKN